MHGACPGCEGCLEQAIGVHYIELKETLNSTRSDRYRATVAPTFAVPSLRQEGAALLARSGALGGGLRDALRQGRHARLRPLPDGCQLLCKVHLLGTDTTPVLQTLYNSQTAYSVSSHSTENQLVPQQLDSGVGKVNYLQVLRDICAPLQRRCRRNAVRDPITRVLGGDRLWLLH